MSFFDPAEDDAPAAQEQPARLLVPTPMGDSDAAAAEALSSSGPTPTPFIMRPVTTVANATANESVANLPLAESSIVNRQAAIPSGESAMRVLLTGESVNMRNAPGLDSQVLTTLPRDTQFNYIGKNDAGDWVQVCCVDNQVAWVYGELAQIEEGSVATQALPLTTGSNQADRSSLQVNATTGTAVQPALQLTTPSTTSAMGLARTGKATTYTSAEDHFAITLPALWLPLVESRGVIKTSIETVQEDNPTMAALLEDQLSTMGDVPVALIAFDLAPETLSTGFATNLNVIKQPIPSGFSLDYVVQFSADQLEQVLGLSGTAESTKVRLPAGEAIMLDYALSGQAVARQYYLMNEQTVYILTFTAAASVADSSIILFNEMMQSFTFTQ